MRLSLHIIIFVLLFSGTCLSQGDIFIGEHGVAIFKSEAPLEIIRAESKTLKGVIKGDSKGFAFTLHISSFQGFNGGIQRVHFLENYMELKKYPYAIFTGKLIEDIPFDTPGTYSVRAKGVLDIHGIQKERIIRGTLTIHPDGAHLQTNFVVPVADHEILIPRIVKQKIADQISVSVDIEFSRDTRS